MNTTMLIKLDKKLKLSAKQTAEELGVPLTTVVNAYLAQFVRDKKFSLSVEPALSQKKLKELLKISDDMDKSKNIGFKTDNIEELFKHLGMK